MARRNKKQSHLDIVLAGNWKVSAFYALSVFLVIFVIFPAFNNPFLNTFSVSLRPFGLIVIGVLLVISAFKFFNQKRLINRAELSTNASDDGNLDQDIVSPFAKTTLTEYLSRPTSWSLKLLQEIEWKRFEDLSTAYYLEKGILAKTTSLGADGGIDIKLYQDGAESATSLVQCKAWNNRQVGVKEIREFLGVLTHEKVAKGFYMTSGGFTDDAKETAKANKIILISGEMFLEMIMRLPQISQKKLLQLAIAGDYKTPSCSACGVKMVKRSGKKGEFWGCKNYPKCRQTMHLKAS